MSLVEFGHFFVNLKRLKKICRKIFFAKFAKIHNWN